MTEAQRKQFFEMRKALDGFVAKIADSPAEINENPAAIRPWKEGAYAVGDVRMYEGAPYKCVQAHDSTENESWNPKDAPGLYAPYHGTDIAHALEYVQPTGVHDAYMTGEYMRWEKIEKVQTEEGEVETREERIYKCLADHTVHAPDVLPGSWEDVTPKSEEPEQEPETEYPEYAQPTGGHDAYNAGVGRATLLRLIEDLDRNHVHVPPDLRREIHALADIDDDEGDA